MKKQKKTRLIKPQQIRFQPGLPMEMHESDAPQKIFTKEQLAMGKAVGSTIKSYLDTSRILLEGKLSQIKDMSPLHLRQPGFVLIFCCSDGVIIRYDSNPDNKKLKLGIAYTDESLSELANKVSENSVYCYSRPEDVPTVQENCPTMTIFATNPTTGEENKIVSMKTCFNTIIGQPLGDLPTPPSKPYCLLSVRNHMEIGMELEIRSDEDLDKPGPHIVCK